MKLATSISCLLLIFLANTTSAQESEFRQANELLISGGVAPNLEPTEFVQGDKFEALQRGRSYVIEFSGTQCGPCIAAIPLMEKLQDSHPELTFVSVFSEDKESVSDFLSGLGKEMTGIVIADENKEIEKAWMQQAGVQGIPHVFVVNSDLKMVWHGGPDELGIKLKVSVDEWPIQEMDKSRMYQLALNRRILQVRDQREERIAKAAQGNNVEVQQLMEAGEYEAAVARLDELMQAYRDLEIYDALKSRKLLCLGRIAGRKEQAYELALDLLAEASLDNATPIYACYPLLNCYEYAYDANRDPRLLLMVEGCIDQELAKANLSHAELVSTHRLAARKSQLQDDSKAEAFHLGRAIDFQQRSLESLKQNGAAQMEVDSASRLLKALNERYEQLER